MEWAEDLFTLKKNAKKGRRAAASTATTPNDPTTPLSGTADDKPGSGTSITSIANSLEQVELNSGAPRPRRTSGWTEDTVKSAGKAGATNAIERERFGRSILAQTSPPVLGDDDADIPVIPDLDDIADLDYSPATATATTPSAGADRTTATATVVNRVAAYRELNSDLLKMGAFASLDGVDLSILTRCLVAEADLHEPDEVWTWEGLFTEVAGDIHGEQQQLQQNQLPQMQQNSADNGGGNQQRVVGEQFLR